MKTKDTSIVGFMCQITPKMYLFFPWKSIFSGWKKWGCEAHIFRWNGRFFALLGAEQRLWGFVLHQDDFSITGCQVGRFDVSSCPVWRVKLAGGILLHVKNGLIT